jgi:hypothetical protein
MAYLLDANVFIQAKNLHYGLDFCPAFWDWLLENNARGTVFSIEQVGDELQGVADELSEWAKPLGSGFFLPTPAEIAPSLTAVSEWAKSQKYKPAAVHTFLQVADYYLVAQAYAGGHFVVSHEVPAKSANIIKVPDACVGMGIKHISPYAMLRRERARFVMGPNG